MPLPAPSAVDRRELIALAWICLVGLACRLAALAQPMRYDEAVSWMMFTSQGWWTILSTYPNPNNHVLFSLLAKATSALAPDEPWALRLPALLAGVAVVPLTWAVGRRLADRTTALLGAALAAGSTSLVLYSVNARGHILVCVATLLLILLADRLRDGGRPRGWVAYGILGALALYAVPVAIYPVGAVSFWLAADAVRRAGGDWRIACRSLMPIAAASVGTIALAGLLYAPIIDSAGLGALLGNKFARALPLPHFLRMMPNFVRELALTWSAPLPWWGAPVLGALALWGIRSSTRDGRASFAVAAIVWCVAVFLAKHNLPGVRFWLSLLPLFLLAAARGLARLAGRLARLSAVGGRLRVDAAPAAMVVALIMGAVALTSRAAETSDDTGRFAPASAVAALVGGGLRPGDRVLAVIPLNGPLLYYLGVRGIDTTYLTTPDSLTRRRFVVLDPTRGQTLDWALRVGLLDPSRDEAPRLLGRPGGAEVWFAAQARPASPAAGPGERER